MSRPQRRARIPGSTAWVTRKADGKVNVQGFTPYLQAERVELRGKEDAGVVDQDVDRAERVLDLGHHGRYLRRIGDVSLDCDAAPGQPPDLLHNDVGLRLGAVKIYGDIGSRTGQSQRSGASDAAGSPGDQRYFAIQSHQELL